MSLDETEQNLSIFITLFILIITFPLQCNSDFNVILPEICQHPQQSFNLTWIEGMVLLGIREEKAHHSLNIWGHKDVCDGSSGLLKFISVSQSFPSSKMIASLSQPLCPTGSTFSKLNKRQFISWTCPQSPGVQSMKPSMGEVLEALERMVNYTGWSSIAITKSRFDRSPYCDDVGASLLNRMRSNGSSNVSVLILGNYEDLEVLEENVSFNNKMDGLFLCISYDYGFTHNLSLKTDHPHVRGKKGIPTVLLPQWPLPPDLFSPGFPTLAIVANPHLKTQSTSSFDFQQKNWDLLDTSDQNVLPHKLLETLLAQMIVRSVKLSLEGDRRDMQYGRYNTNAKSEGLSKHLQTEDVHDHGHKEHEFLFSILQYEKGRWHPLINLVKGEKHLKGSQGNHRWSFFWKATASTLPPGVGSSNNKDNTKDIKLKEDYLVTWFQIVAGMITTTLLVMSVILIGVYARRKGRKRDFSSAKHSRKLSRRHRVPGSSCKLILTSEDLSFGQTQTENNKKGTKSPFTGSFPSFQRTSSQEKEKPDLLKGSFPSGATSTNATTVRKQSSVTNMKSNGNDEGAGDNTARYKGEVVYLKKLCLTSNESSFEVKAKAVTVLETIHGLRHENLATLVGCLLASGSPLGPCLVWEFCSRGSLHDIITQSDIKMDWAFKLSLLTDLVRGMRYLHSSLVRVHGCLTSYNCVIDARWVLKITDFGLPAFYYAEGILLPSKTAKELLWTAPELLRDENLRHQGTQAGDVYSFAIIMQEVLVRGVPYCMLTLTAEEILEKVKRPPPLIRPSVSKGAAPPEAINIMRQCWAELPDMRPDFMVIHDLFKTLNHGRKANIVDTMFQMLEKYSNNLEELIRERTQELDLERKKTEQLLNRMLPNTVAEKLKLGLPVDPEDFSEVTIYFSDIVGFTTISAYSTPFEVVDLLNDLYTCFDATINDYNVYKVETIGDGYMVVGGAPLWSPDHADQIALMALDLLYQSGRFKIRHLPYTPLRLRIGLHTGPCCAGVVGLTMPRYCLFGDTVNTASRMESTGAPWRIHISEETKAKLDEAGGYITEPRGLTDIKGKGRMLTHWLLGKEGFDKELPNPPGLNECHRLDEKDIIYGRTGVCPEENKDNKIPSSASVGEHLKTNTTSSSTSGGVIKGESSKSKMQMSPHHLAPPKSPSSFAMVQAGESVRSLSPAEQIAHQLLNGRPTTKGLRRQLSLDHRAMPILLQQAQQAVASTNLRRAPSLEENLENPSSPKHYHETPTIRINNTTVKDEDASISIEDKRLIDSLTPSPVFSSCSPMTHFYLTNEVSSSTSPSPSGGRLSTEGDHNNYNPPQDNINSPVSTSPDPITNQQFQGKVNYVVVESTSNLGGNGHGVTVKDLSESGGKRISCNTKLAKILSVVEEGADSPRMERKYEIVTNQV